MKPLELVRLIALMELTEGRRRLVTAHTSSGHCADGLRGRLLEVTGNRHDADYVPFAFFLGDIFVLTTVVT
jgi:hypothetical protein